MLDIIVRQANKPTVKNFNLLARIAYELTDLEFYNSYILNYYACDSKYKNSFITQFWILRDDVKKLINK